MTIHQSGVTLRCDGCGISKVFRSSEEAAAWARRAEWKETGREHACTTCQQKATLKK